MEKKTFSITEVTNLLGFKNEETVRRYIRAGHKAGNNIDIIKTITNKKDAAYLSLCTVPNKTPYQITFESLSLFIQRKRQLKKETADNLLNSFSNILPNPEKCKTIAAYIGALAAFTAAGGVIGGGLAGIAGISAISITDTIKKVYADTSKKKKSADSSTNISDKLIDLSNNKKVFEENIEKLNETISEINSALAELEKNIKIIEEKYKEQTNIYKTDLKKCTDYLDLYTNELNITNKKIKELSNKL